MMTSGNFGKNASCITPGTLFSYRRELERLTRLCSSPADCYAASRLVLLSPLSLARASKDRTKHRIETQMREEGFVPFFFEIEHWLISDLAVLAVVAISLQCCVSVYVHDPHGM